MDRVLWLAKRREAQKQLLAGIGLALVGLVCLMVGLPLLLAVAVCFAGGVIAGGGHARYRHLGRWPTL